MADTRPSPLPALARGLEIGAIASTWIDRHPKWLGRLAASVEMPPAQLHRLMIVLITARHCLPRAVFEWAAQRERWIVFSRTEHVEALREAFEPWWRAFLTPLHVWRATPPKELAHPEAQAVAIMWLHALVEMLGPIQIEPPADLELFRLLAPISWPVAGLALIGEGLAGGRHQLESPERIAATWEVMRAAAVGPLERHGLLPATPLVEQAADNLFTQVEVPTPMQELVSSVSFGRGPQLFVMEEASGAGKTEAAILLAHRLVAAGAGETIFFALPWTAVPRAVQQRAVDVQALLFRPTGAA